MSGNSPLGTKLNYLPVIDSLRAIAASMVCLFHFVCTTTGFVTNATILKVFSFGKFGVHMFFVISGIVIPMTMFNGNYSLSKLPRFIGKRFIRIEPPYIVSIILALGYLYIRKFVPGTVITEAPSNRDILLHIGYLVPFVKDAKWLTPVYWTLAIEFQYYLIISLIFSFLFSKSLYKRIPCYLLLLFSGYFVPQAGYVIFWLPVFLVGIAFVLNKSGTIKPVEYIILSLASFILIGIHLGITTLVVSMFTISMVYFFSNARNKISGFIGDVSYSLYLLHSIIGAAFVNYLSHHTTNPISKTILVIAGYLVSLAGAWLLYKLVEKPSKTLSSKLKYT